MTVAPESSSVKKALSAHAVIGLLAGMLLYIVSLTGTVAVFYEEWQRIEQPNAPEMASIDPQAVERGVAAVLASEAGKPPTTHLYVHLPVDALPRATVTTDTQAVHLDAAGRIAGKEEIAWADFLVELHYLLNIPGVIGLTIVGLLGVMMLALALSGVIAHPRIFRDAFRLRARDNSGVGLADWHNRLSVWTLPFTLAIALTGAMIGLGTVTAYGLAQVSYKGDFLGVFAPIFGPEGKVDKAKAPVPAVATALEYMNTRHPGLRLTYLTIHDPLTAGQHIQILGTPGRRLIYGETYEFDARGRFHGTLGIGDGPIGRQASASSYNLHFGNFGGLPVKIAYFVFGIVLTGICATGTYIWLGKRRRRGIDEPRLRAVWDAVVWGSPLVITATFLLRKILGNDVPFVPIYWLATAALILAACLLPAPQFMEKLLKRSLAAVLMLATALVIFDVANL